MVLMIFIVYLEKRLPRDTTDKPKDIIIFDFIGWFLATSQLSFVVLKTKNKLLNNVFKSFNLKIRNCLMLF